MGDRIQAVGNVHFQFMIDQLQTRGFTLRWEAVDHGGGIIRATQRDKLTGAVTTLGFEIEPRPASTEYAACADGVTLVTGMETNGRRFDDYEIDEALTNIFEHAAEQPAANTVPATAPPIQQPALPAQPISAPSVPPSTSDQQEEDEDRSFYTRSRFPRASQLPIIVSDEGSTWCCLTVGDVALKFSTGGASYTLQTYDDGNVALDLEDPQGRWRGWKSFELTFIATDQNPRSPMRPSTIDVDGKTVLTDEPSEEVTISQLLRRTFALQKPSSAKVSFGQPYDHCMATRVPGQGEQSAMTACIDDEYSRRDDKLNAVYRAKMAALPPARRTTLRASERQWLSALQVRCALPSDGGDLQKFEAVYCLAAETKHRTEAIAAMR